MTTIYAMLDPDGAIRYIGKTVNRLSHRRIAHTQDAKHGKAGHRCNWIRSLLSRGSRPDIVPIETCAGDGAAEERYHIALARSDGLKLVNDTDGGEGVLGRKHTEADREKMRANSTVRGVPRPPHVKEAISRAHKGQKKKPESVAKTRAALKRFYEINGPPPPYTKGRTLSAEHKAKCSAALRGRKRTPEQIEKTISKLRGRKASDAERARLWSYNVARMNDPEWSAKARAQNLGRKWTAGQREKFSAANKGRKHSAEHIAKREAARQLTAHGDSGLRRYMLSEFVRRRKAVGVGRGRVAAAARMHKSAIQSYENGKFLPGIKTLARMVLAVNLFSTTLKAA